MQNAANALRVILESVHPVSSERCSLSRLYQRVLAADVIAPHDVPLFDNSSMDGYALRSEDVATAGDFASVRLALQGIIQAGSTSSQSLAALHTIRVMTGAQIPPGADAVVEQELVTTQNGSVTVTAPVHSGRNIRRKGDDIQKGSIVVGKGTRLKSAHVGALASVGILEAEVYHKPRVAFLTTGNELVEVNATPLPGQIRNSNSFTLRGLINESGCEPVDLGSSADSQSELREKIETGIANDGLVTSGGVSVGEFDLVLETLKSIGTEIKFWKVNIKPGMPMAFGISRNGVPVFALPGNPVSTMVTFLQFARPGLRRLSGESDCGNALRIKATLEDSLKKSDSKRHFVRGIVRNEKGRLVVRTTGSQSSAVMTSLTKANCLVIVPEESMGIDEGKEVEIELL